MKVTGRVQLIAAGLCTSALIMLLLTRPAALPEAIPTVTPRPIKPTPTPTLSLILTLPPQPWNTSLRLAIIPEAGAWLRSEPSHQLLDASTILLPTGAVVRVIGQPVYEVNPGQWWWLVSAETDGIGWVEEASLMPALDSSR